MQGRPVRIMSRLTTPFVFLRKIFHYGYFPASFISDWSMSRIEKKMRKIRIYGFRYFITGVSKSKFPVLIMRTCEPVTLLYTAG